MGNLFLSQDILTFHCYPLSERPWAYLYARELSYDDGGWPVVGAPVQPADYS